MPKTRDAALLITRIAFRHSFAHGANTLDQRFAHFFKLHNLRLLLSHDIIKLV